MNVIRKIFSGVSGKDDKEVHNAFIKFSKGSFPDRYLLEGKKQKDKFVVKTSAEFVNFLVANCLKKLPAEKVQMKGAIISTLKIQDELGIDVERVKQFMGIKQNLINTEVEPGKILGAMEKFPKAFFALTFKGDNFELKVKAKAPKSAKPGSKGDKGAKADFATLKSTDSELVKDLFFDVPEFKKIEVNHTIVIDQIEVDTSISDPVEMRESAVRKGKIIRSVVVDEQEKKSESDLIA
tara:strand:+ start:22 stop:735 length:714 start_codon:yes stop_codon:yes gene_type:complete